MRHVGDRSSVDLGAHDRRAMHISTMRVRIIKCSQMLRWDVVPHQGITNFPAVSVYELGLRGVRAKFSQKLIAFSFSHADDLNCMPLVNEQ